MEFSHKKIEQMNQRLEKIEKQNRRLKKTMGIFLLFFAGFILMGSTAAIQDGRFKMITAQGITIVNSAGQKVITIGSVESGTGMRIFNKAGKRVMGLGITSDERGSGFLIADNEGRPRIGGGMDKGLPTIAMVDEKGKKIMAMGAGKNGHGLVIMDENEVERAGLGYKNGHTGFMIFDDKGQYVRGMIRQKDGVHYSSYVDENGKEIITR